MHRLDRINAKKPAKLLDSRSLALSSSRKQIWPVFLCYSTKCCKLARLVHGQILAAAVKATQTSAPYQWDQFWIRRFHRQTEGLCATLAALVQPVPATDFVRRALRMLEGIGRIPAHRFLFGDLRAHLG